MCRNLAEHNTADITISIHTLPIIANMAKIDAAMNHRFKLRAGRSAETSGGLFVGVADMETAKQFCAEMESLTGRGCWIVGEVLAGGRSARIEETAEIIEVELSY